MRFTVHDSPDYYQLKVSVFNDDKKTELIGETWIALDQIIKPGGGKNDVWHHLNCKGRFAGEIRIELTYYDIRPREEKAEERRQSAPIDASMGQASSGVGGPRQPKQVKRRPLPADPTDPFRSSPLPYTPPTSTQQRYVESPNDYGFESTPPPDRRQESLQTGPPRGSPSGSVQQPPMPYSGEMSSTPLRQQSAPNQLDAFDSLEPNDYHQPDSNTFSKGPQNGYRHERSDGYELEDGEDWQSRPLVQPLQEPQGMIHSHSLPTMVDARPRQHPSQGHPYCEPSPPKSYSYHLGPASSNPRRDNYSAAPYTDELLADEEDAPPRPPIHRNSGSRPTSESQGRGQSDPYVPVPATAPLNIRNGRGSITGSPLSQTHITTSSYTGYPPSASSSNLQSYSQPAPSASSHTSYSQVRSERSLSPMRDFDQQMPPSLVPGYEPGIAEDESDRIVHEKRMSALHHYSDPPRPQFQQAPAPTDRPQPSYRASAPMEQPQPQFQQAPVPQPHPRNIENVHNRRIHRASAPVIQPQAASPGPRTPMRKSVSPSPGSAPTERRHSEVPFSPDSFDAFNPSMSTGNGVNEPGARYNTPEQAREATLLHQRQEKLGDGPIIGIDGRVIDPSDHLPTDTWAPEPEQKTPKKGPQITMRFKHSPQGAQPMPAARRPAVEHSMSSPIYPASPETASPASAGRVRLQKKSRTAMPQPASSPLVPTLNSTQRSSPLRSSETSYPLRERENYGGYGSSPTYGRPSPGNIPPPIPGKIPISGGQEDWDTSALSEEMRMIDIGVGGGQGRQRRSRFGV